MYGYLTMKLSFVITPAKCLQLIDFHRYPSLEFDIKTYPINNILA